VNDLVTGGGIVAGQIHRQPVFLSFSCLIIGVMAKTSLSSTACSALYWPWNPTPAPNLVCASNSRLYLAAFSEK